ncbi:hypothetical protein BJ912DRAFT_1108388 [Pholiota molesta]|nr:hypothetical protein BJ912DRAFT_1108388 [Pholiota molesta]
MHAEMPRTNLSNHKIINSLKIKLAHLISNFQLLQIHELFPKFLRLLQLLYKHHELLNLEIVGLVYLRHLQLMNREVNEQTDKSRPVHWHSKTFSFTHRAHIRTGPQPRRTARIIQNYAPLLLPSIPTIGIGGGGTNFTYPTPNPSQPSPSCAFTLASYARKDTDTLRGYKQRSTSCPWPITQCRKGHGKVAKRRKSSNAWLPPSKLPATSAAI